MSGKSAIHHKKPNIIKTHGLTPQDTGSSQVQVALLTTHINELNIHFKAHPKDHSSRRGLLKMVGQRRRLLNYLKKSDQLAYSKLIQALELRK